MLKQELLNRNLPELRSREEMVEIMQREVYGYLPKNDLNGRLPNQKTLKFVMQKVTFFIQVLNLPLPIKMVVTPSPFIEFYIKTAKSTR